MQSCALITAAGLSSRMKDFKPLLKIGNESIVGRCIRTLLLSGVDNAVIVTGFRAEDIRSELAHLPVVFAHNPVYETSHMFDSVCIGLKKISEVFPQCEKIVFTPVDMAGFSHQTVQMLLSSSSPLTIPVFAGKCGHPIIWEAELNPQIMSHDGSGGLKGAFCALGIHPTHINVPDIGVLMDADTPDDYEVLRSYCEYCDLTDAGGEVANCVKIPLNLKE